ncbi:hypothetical protein TNCT_430381 [Trichonephila clavata]|uniref:Uncharacterized protein n=1 Tax=Trichonephila clavata TaxID=2740835 RepID=A0A8X6G9U7_TRICU|nr:hypothetical protein TNCT_430381 [Trichonephila clavata]
MQMKRFVVRLGTGSSGVLFLVSGQGRDPHRVTGGDLLRRMTRLWVRRSPLLDDPQWPGAEEDEVICIHPLAEPPTGNLVRKWIRNPVRF